MFPVYSSDRTASLGISYRNLAGSLVKICEKHLRDKRARGFAFVFYPHDSTLARALNDQEGFRILNEVSGRDLTIFYLSNPFGFEDAFPAFNRSFLRALNVADQVAPPCIVFFRVEQGRIDDVQHFRIGEEEDYLMVEHLRRRILEVLESWKQQGDLSGLSLTSLASFSAMVMKAAALMKH